MIGTCWTNSGWFGGAGMAPARGGWAMPTPSGAAILAPWVVEEEELGPLLRRIPWGSSRLTWNAI